MGSRKTRLAALLLAGVGALGMVSLAGGGVAQATVPLNRVSPPYPDATQCNGAKQAFLNWSDVGGEGACEYYSSYPTSAANGPADYYFMYNLTDSSSCGQGCHTPQQANPPIPVAPNAPTGCTGRIVCNPE